MNHKMYYIEWTDSCTHHGWMPKECLKDVGIAKCASCGFLVRDGKKEVVLAINKMLDEQGSYGDTISIPVQNITFRKKL